MSLSALRLKNRLLFSYSHVLMPSTILTEKGRMNGEILGDHEHIDLNIILI